MTRKFNLRYSSLTLAAGALALTGSMASADIQHLDDVIISFSLCVGNDCVNGESFGFDTIRLKENNLRINFQDTSSSASFPTNDWRFVANDSSNGGDNYLAIEDSSAGRQVFRVDAGAPSNALRVDSGGDVGIGQSNPVVELHITDGDSPTVRLEQDGSSGFTAQTWDLAGNEANFFIRDVTNGSKLPFRIFPGAASDALNIEATGDIGLGTRSPDAALHVLDGGAVMDVADITTAAFQNNASTTDNIRVSMIAGNAGNVQLGFGDADNEIAGRIRYNHGSDTMDFFYGGNQNALTLGGTAGSINILTTGANVITTDTSTAVLTSAGVWQNASSRALKQNIRDLSLTDALDTLEGLEPVTYNYKVEPGETTVGFIAEDVPDLVATASHKTLSSMDIVAVLTRVVQEQRDVIGDLEAQASAQDARIDALYQRLDALKN